MGKKGVRGQARLCQLKLVRRTVIQESRQVGISDLEILVEKDETYVFLQQGVVDELPSGFVLVDAAAIRVLTIIQCVRGWTRIQAQRDIEVPAAIIDQRVGCAAANDRKVFPALAVYGRFLEQIDSLRVAVFTIRGLPLEEQVEPKFVNNEYGDRGKSFGSSPNSE